MTTGTATSAEHRRPMPPLTAHHFVARWTAVSLLAEITAVSVALGAGANTWDGVAAAAAIEGVLLGVGQSWALRAANAALQRSWLFATIAGALIGRAIEFAADTSSVASTVSGLPAAAQAAGGVLLGATVGAAMAAPQVVVLARHVDRPWRWLLVRGGAWAVGLPSLLLATGSLAAFFAGLVFVAVIVGAIEGFALSRMLRPLFAWSYGVLPRPGDGWERARGAR